MSTEPVTNSSFWIDSITSTNITVGNISKNLINKELTISEASNITESIANIRFEIKGKRYNGDEFLRSIDQNFVLVKDGKGLQITIKGSKNTLAEIEAIIDSMPGDAWVNNEDGHIYVFDGSTWNDSGKFEGDPGKDAVVHFAYADKITFEIDGRTANSAEGFTLDDFANKVWLGVYWDNIPGDNTDFTAYNWTRIKGNKGDKGADGTSVSIKGEVDNPSELESPPNVSVGDGYISKDTGDLWIFDDNTQVPGATFGWINVGKIQGTSSYIHIAWADNVTFSGETFSSVVNFDLENGNKKRWYGVYVDDIEEDAEESEAYKYNWVDTKGEAGKDSKAEEFIFIRNNNSTFSDIPPSEQEDNYVPTHLGWTDNPVGVEPNFLYEWVSVRKYRNDLWEDFSTPSIWNIYVTNGEDGKDSKSDEYIFHRTANHNFGIADNRPPSPQQDDHEPVGWSDVPQGVTELEQYEFVCKRIYRDDLWSEYSIPSLWAKWSKDGKSPYISFETDSSSPLYENGIKYWYVWDNSVNEGEGGYVNSGDPSQGDDGKQPKINEYGFWEVWADLGDGTFGYTPTLFKAVGDDSKADEFIYIKNDIENFTTVFTISQTDGYIPPGWSPMPVGTTSNEKFQWVSVRKYKNKTWGNFSPPTLWSKYTEEVKAIPYIAGKWEGSQVNGIYESTKIYARTENSYPIVSWLSVQGKTQYYFLKEEVVVPIGSPSPQNDETNWQKAEGYEVIFAEALFAGIIQVNNGSLSTAGISGSRRSRNYQHSLGGW